MKKKTKLPLLITALTLPLVLGGCHASIGDKKGETIVSTGKETYVMGEKDYLAIHYGAEKLDVYTTEQYHSEKLYSYDGSSYWIKGNFTIKLTYWEFGIDVKVSGMPEYSEITFVYRGMIDYQLIKYNTAVQETSQPAPESQDV